MDVRVIKKEIKQIFQHLKIPPHFKGYEYAIDCLVELMYDRRQLSRLVKGLYVKVAEKHSTTPTRAERGIRYLIERASQSNPEIWGKYFVNSRPSNKEFLATVLGEIIDHDSQGEGLLVLPSRG